MILQFLVLQLLDLSSSVDYCKLNCDGIPHVACQWPNPYCKPKTNTCMELDEDLKIFRKAIIDHHNKIRNRLALGQLSNFPSAADMTEMIYDECLEFAVLCSVNECKTRQNSCHITDQFITTGQNVFYRTRKIKVKTVPVILEIWTAESEDFDNLSVIDRFRFDKKTSNFTQIIWAETTHVGCARSWNMIDNTFLLICNYGPSGNILNEPIYKKGTPCSECQGKCSKLYPGLCVNGAVNLKRRESCYGFNDFEGTVSTDAISNVTTKGAIKEEDKMDESKNEITQSNNKIDQVEHDYEYRLNDTTSKNGKGNEMGDSYDNLHTSSLYQLKYESLEKLLMKLKPNITQGPNDYESDNSVQTVPSLIIVTIIFTILFLL